MRSRREHNKRSKRLTLYLAGGIGACILLFFIAPPAFLRSAIFTAGRPIWFVSNRITGGFSGIQVLLRSNRSLTEENARLKNTISELEAKEKTTAALRASNQTFMDLLRKKGETKGIFAGVLSGPPHTPYDTILIDAGTEDGVSLHDPVVAWGDIAVGTISHTGKGTSEVVLYSSPSVETPAILLAATSSIAVTLAGQGGGNFLIKLPRGVSVATDSPVVLPGAETILIASVGAVFEKPADAFETVLAASPFTLQGLRFVEVIPKVHE